MPRSCRPARAFSAGSSYKHLGIRRQIYGAYLIFYRVEFEQIEVLHIVHGALDYEAALFRDE